MISDNESEISLCCASLKIFFSFESRSISFILEEHTEVFALKRSH